jgi:general secretion pathway protein A
MHRRLRADPLTPADTVEYVRMRLARVGCDRELFASDAVAMIHEASLGGMRDTDGIATAALRDAARKKRNLVERDAVARVIDAQTNGDTGT